MIGNKRIINTIVGLVIVLVLLFLYYSKQNRSKSILNNAEYSIGTITQYNERQYKKDISGGTLTTKSEPAYVEFDYTYKGGVLHNYYSENTFSIPENGVKLGDKYLVAYNKDNPQKSFILFDKPINDSSDYNYYLIELTK